MGFYINIKKQLSSSNGGAIVANRGAIVVQTPVKSPMRHSYTHVRAPASPMGQTGSREAEAPCARRSGLTLWSGP